jgi:hypothetical protein
MIRRQRRRPLRKELTGLADAPDPTAVHNIAGYDQCPPHLRNRIAYHPRPMVFVKTPDGRVLLAEFHHVDWPHWAQRQP